MKLVDTHAHIYLEELASDQNDILERAEKEGVAKILMPAIDSSTHPAMLELEESRPGICFSMMGVHPCSVKENYLEELKIAEDHFQKRAFKAVGEIGLDFYWEK